MHCLCKALYSLVLLLEWALIVVTAHPVTGCHGNVMCCYWIAIARWGVMATCYLIQCTDVRVCGVLSEIVLVFH